MACGTNLRFSVGLAPALPLPSCQPSIPHGTGSLFPPDKTDTGRHNPFLLSIAFPNRIPKKWDSKFIVYLYKSNRRLGVLKNLNIEFIKEQINEILRKSEVDLDANIRVSLRSNDIVFEPEYVQKKVKEITRFDFLGRPKEDCIVKLNSVRQVLLVISDAVTGETYQSEYFSVNVVDIVFGFIPRPLINVMSSVVVGVGSISMFILTLVSGKTATQKVSPMV